MVATGKEYSSNDLSVQRPVVAHITKLVQVPIVLKLLADPVTIRSRKPTLTYLDNHGLWQHSRSAEGLKPAFLFYV